MNAAFAQWCCSVGLELSADQVAAFATFELNLYRKNEVVNLTRVPAEQCGIRHFADSLLFQDLLPQGAKVLDIGTGPGFPAWPLACARPDLLVTALDSNGKMLDFLRSQPLPNLKVVLGRAEEAKLREQFDVVTGRAVAPLSIQLEISAAPCRMGGLVIPMRSGGEELGGINLAPLGLKKREVVTRELADTGIVRAFPIYEKVASTQAGYPRRWAEIKAKPL